MLKVNLGEETRQTETRSWGKITLELMKGQKIAAPHFKQKVQRANSAQNQRVKTMQINVIFETSHNALGAELHIPWCKSVESRWLSYWIMYKSWANRGPLTYQWLVLYWNIGWALPWQRNCYYGKMKECTQGCIISFWLLDGLMPNLALLTWKVQRRSKIRNEIKEWSKEQDKKWGKKKVKNEARNKVKNEIRNKVKNEVRRKVEIKPGVNNEWGKSHIMGCCQHRM